MNIPFLTVMGLAAAGTVSIAVLIAITLLPAAIGFAGDRLGRRTACSRSGRAAAARDGSRPSSERWAQFVTRRPLAVLAVGLSALLLIAIPAMHLRLGCPTRARSRRRPPSGGRTTS